MTVRFDAYTATTAQAKVTELLPWFFEGHADRTLSQGKGFHTFGERIAVKDSTGSEVGSLSWGGRQGDRVMVEAKGEWTPQLVARMRAADLAHRCTRVDSCADFERPGVFDELLAPVLAVKQEHKLYGQKLGDWDQPEFGRTVFLGAASSPIRARLYEKGKQPELRHLERFNLCRLEIQVRPQKEAKEDFARLDALEVWGASKWTRQLAEEVLHAKLDAHPPGTVRRDSQRDKALRWMVKQYGPHLVSLAADLGGWDVMGLTLGEMLSEERARAVRMRKARHE